MYQCEFWSCVDEVADMSPLCIDHTVLLDNDELDECASCEQYKESEFTLCGNCESLIQYGNLLDFNTDDYVAERDDRHIADMDW